MARVVRRALVSVALLLGVQVVPLAAPLASAEAPAAPDARAQAREAALSGRRLDAITILLEHLEAHREDTDARTLLGLVLSWEGRYDEARFHLEQVLARHPTHGDALPALVNVELWSRRIDRADRLTAEAIERAPGAPAVLLTRARVLIAQDRTSEAVSTLNRVLEQQPGHDEALRLRQRLRESPSEWQARVSETFDWFNDDRAAWRETDISIRRRTVLGPVLVHGRRADRFGLQDSQVEVEAYPRLGRRTQAYLSVGLAPAAVLYPAHRLGFDLYQGLGHGTELVAGYRRLGFSAPVNIFVMGLDKYHGNWMFMGRAYVTPRPAGASRSLHATVRRYFGDGTQFVGLRYGHGSSRQEVRNLNDLEVLGSDTLSGELDLALTDRLRINVGAVVGREERVFRSDLRQHSFNAGLAVRF